MKTTPSTPVSADKLENELAPLATLVQQAFSRAGEPSPRVIRAIRDEAVAHLSARNRSRRLFIPLFRTLSAAATLALLLGGAFQVHLFRLEGANVRVVGHLLNLGSTHLSAETAEVPAELANRLLRIQGLDEEAFFVMPEEPEALWL